MTAEPSQQTVLTQEGWGGLAQRLFPLKLQTRDTAKGVSRQYQAQSWSRQGLCWMQAYWSQMAVEVPATAAENSAGNYCSCS